MAGSWYVQVKRTPAQQAVETLLVLTLKKKILSSIEFCLRLSHVYIFPAWKKDLSTQGHILLPQACANRQMTRTTTIFQNSFTKSREGQLMECVGMQ